jgi:hypothetical protein
LFAVIVDRPDESEAVSAAEKRILILPDNFQ